MKNIDTSNWKEFKIGDLFEIKLAKGDIQPNLVDEGEIPLISAGNENNGIVKYIDSKGDGVSEIFPSGCITISMFGKAFYQTKPFYAVSHGRINILEPYQDIPENVGKFIASIIDKLFLEKFGYATMCTRTRIQNETIKLPAKSDIEPDWEYMEKYMKDVEEEVIEKISKMESINEFQKQNIDVSNWKEFKFGDLFNILRGKSKIMRNLSEGTVPVIAAARANQGVAGYYDVNVEYENTITISCNGVGCGSTFYHDGGFALTGDSAVCLFHDDVSKNVKLFLSAVLDKMLSQKYSYSEKCGPDVLLDEVIKLPVNEDSKPDWDFMETYVDELMKKAESNVDKFRDIVEE